MYNSILQINSFRIIFGHSAEYNLFIFTNGTKPSSNVHGLTIINYISTNFKLLACNTNQYILQNFSKLTVCRVGKSSLNEPALCLYVSHTSIFTYAAATQCKTTTLLHNASNITIVCAATVT
jgi:hypothetical protein